MIERRVERAAVVLLPLVALSATVPVGWDRGGPIRWFALPALGFALVAVGLGRDGAGPERRAGAWPGDPSRVAGLTGLAWTGLLAWGALAAAVGADPLHAWIGSPDRRFGWLTWLLCGGLFLVGRRLDAATVVLAVRATAIGALGLGLHTLAQWIGLLDDGGFDGGRLGGPLGQPAYLGAAAALAAPVAAGLALDRAGSSRWRAIGGLGATTAVAALLLSQSRAAWVGALVAVGLVGLTRLVTGRAPDGPPTGSSTGSPAGSSAATPPGSPIAELPWAVPAAVALPLALIVAIPSLRDRVVGAADDGGVIDGRLAEWRVGLRALGDAPVVGHGPEGYRTVFGANVDEAYVVDFGRDVLTDRAHNGLLDTGLAFGLPGLAIAAVLLAAIAAAGVRVGARGPAPRSGLAIGVVGYLAAQQFLFPLSELDPLCWLLAGIVVAASADPDRSTGPTTARSNPSGLAAAGRGLAIGLAVVTGLAGLADLVADADVAAALDGEGRGDPNTATATTRDPDRALVLRPDSTRYRFLASRIATARGEADLALDRVDEGLDRSPADPALRAERAALLLERARAAEEAEPDRSAAVDRAVAELEALVADDPLHPRHLQRLGIALALDGRLDEARASLERAVELAPDDPEALANLDVVTSLISTESGG